MRILIDINHPGQIHLFKNAVREWENHGHEVLMVVRDKDVTIDLVKAYGIRFMMGTARRAGYLNLLIELFRKSALLISVCKQFKPDVCLSLGSPPAAWAAKYYGIPHIAFDDTEHSLEQYYLFAPFTPAICTPSCFKRELGSKQYRYPGYHELAYLHPSRFRPDPQVLALAGLKENETFSVVRFVSWEATHDIGQHGFSYDGKRQLVEQLRERGRVIITSEAPLTSEFEQYRLQVAPHHIHDLLYYSSLYIGEGATMASEAAMLGIPSIYVNSITAGTIEEQERYGLVYRLPGEKEAIAKAMSLLGDSGTRAEHQSRRERMLTDKIDVTDWMVNFVERYVGV